MPRKALRGVISKVDFYQVCQLGTTIHNKMAPRTGKRLQDRGRDTPTKGLLGFTRERYLCKLRAVEAHVPFGGVSLQTPGPPHVRLSTLLREVMSLGTPTVLNLRTTASQKCKAIPKRAGI